MTEFQSLTFKDKRKIIIQNSELKGIDFCRAWTELLDKEIQLLFFELDDNESDNLTVVAVGSYGRQELCPFSDIDITIIYDKKKNISKVVDKLLYPLWDLGIKVDHSVRTPKETIKAMQSDLKVILGLMDARFVVGKVEYAHRAKDLAVENWKKMVDTFVPELIKLTNEREFKFGDLAYLLEPDLKESHGGLRDLSVIDSYNLATNRIKTEDVRLTKAKSILLNTRVELHRNLTRYSDKFALQEQDKVAKALGYSKTDDLMREISSASEAISIYLNNLQYSIINTLNPKAAMRLSNIDLTSIDENITIENGFIDIKKEFDFTNSVIPLKLAVAATVNKLRIEPDLYRTIAASFKVDYPLKQDIVEELLKLFSFGDDALDSILNLEYYGILSKILPYWASVRNKPQRNAYHTYTVSRHLIQTAINASKLIRQVTRPDLLIYGCLFHDIGKGFEGDHTLKGMELIDEIGRDMGFTASDIGILKQMIEYHLLLADLATRRDIEDPVTVQTVVDKLNSEELLDLMVSLTEADSLATGPAAWGTWKQQLINELALKAKSHMSGKTYVIPDNKNVLEKFKSHMENQQEVEVLYENNELTVIANDRQGLFAVICGVISLNSLEIIKANAVNGTHNKVIDIFRIQPIYERQVDAVKIQNQIISVLNDELDLTTEIKNKESVAKVPKQRLSAFQIEPKILIENTASLTSTVIELRSTDRIGLLYKIASILTKHSLNIRSAIVSTIGIEAIDVFYVTDNEGSKIQDEPLIEQLLKDLEEAVSN